VLTAWSATFTARWGRVLRREPLPSSRREGVAAVENCAHAAVPCPRTCSRRFDPRCACMADGIAAYARLARLLSHHPRPSSSKVVDKVKFMMGPASTNAAPKDRRLDLGLSPDSNNKDGRLHPASVPHQQKAGQVRAGRRLQRPPRWPPKPTERSIHTNRGSSRASRTRSRDLTDPTWGQTQGAVGTAVNGGCSPTGRQGRLPGRAIVPSSRRASATIRRRRARSA